MKRIFALIIVALLSVASAFAQTVSGVSVSQVGKTVVVSYDIDKACPEVSLTVSMDGGRTFSAPLKAVSGDVKNVQPGHRSIVWDVLAERENLKGDNIVFEVIAGSDDWVDLGLSVKWATCNLGASKPEEYGRYFAWGDVKGQTWDGSSWSGGGFHDYPSYQLNSNGNLRPEYDAAHVLLGGKWRMPTKAECRELINNCTSEWTTVNGVKGRLFTSKKSGYTDRSIFLPAAGSGYYDGLSDAGSIGDYWSGTFYYDYGAWSLSFYSGDVDTYSNSRYYGRPVRPVSEQ